MSAMVLSRWSSRFLDEVLPPPARVVLALENFLRGEGQRLEDRFRVVVCWLENDRNGDNTKFVEPAFVDIEGVTVVRSAREVKASGAGADWPDAMQRHSRSVMQKFNADLAVAGLVKKSGKALSLWIVPRSGSGTLIRGDNPYGLETGSLGSDFHEHFRLQLTTAALVALAPLAETRLRSKVLEEGLRTVTEQLATLLNTPDAIQDDEMRVPLLLEFGDARVPLDWAETQSTLGIALAGLV